VEGGAFVRFRALWCRQRKTACHYFGSSEVPRAVRLASRAGPIFRRTRCRPVWPGDRVLE
jgi:hypothetical protein